MFLAISVERNKKKNRTQLLVFFSITSETVTGAVRWSKIFNPITGFKINQSNFLNSNLIIYLQKVHKVRISTLFSYVEFQLEL